MEKVKKGSEFLYSYVIAHKLARPRDVASVPDGTAVNEVIIILCVNFCLLTCIDQAVINI